MRLGMGVFLLGAFLFASASNAGPGGSRIKAFVERVNEVIPRVTKQITKVVDGSKLATICTAACILHFSLPATATDFNRLSMHSELLKRRGHHSIFARRGSEEQGFKGTWRISTGLLNDHEGRVGTLKLGFEGETPRLDFYVNGVLNYDPHTIEKIDVEKEVYAGINFLWNRDKLEDSGVVLGYHGIDVFAGDKPVLSSSRNYIFYYENKGFLHLALIGVEYFDGEAQGVQGSDALRGVFSSFYRASLNRSHTTATGVEVSIGLNSVLGGGSFWQDELLEWFDRTELHNNFFHKGALRLEVATAEETVSFALGGSYATIFNGEYGNGDSLFVGESVVSASLGIVLLPEYDINLEGYLEARQQKISAERGEDSAELSLTNSEQEFAVFFVKRFE